MPLRGKRFEFGSSPPELEGFWAETRVGSAVRRNRIGPTAQKDHNVFFRNLAADEIDTSVVSRADYPRLSYVDLDDHRCWVVAVDSVATDEDITQVALLRHDDTSCRHGNQHKVVLQGTFQAMYPGAPPHSSTVTLVLRCN
jgi:hypothetical protein